MIRTRKEIDDMFSFISWAADYREHKTEREKTAINNIYAAIQEVEQEDEEENVSSYWYKESQKLKQEVALLRKDLKELSDLRYGKANEKKTN
jgi:hypothetical protein